MPIPLNSVFLDTLAKGDLLACMALTDTSKTLSKFILNEVLTTATICRFLHQNQYLMHHDIYGSFVTVQERAWLRTAVETLRQRNEEHFYMQVLPVLGPLLGLTPLSRFERTPPLDPDFKVPGPPDRKGRSRGFIPWAHIREIYEHRLRKSWIHHPQRLKNAGDFDFFSDVKKVPYADVPYLQEDYLFCGRYLMESHLSFFLSNTIKLGVNGSEAEARVKIDNLRTEFTNSGLCLIQQKRTLQSCFQRVVRPYSLESMSADTFLSFFKNPEWLKLWTIDELGWWCALGLSKYGSVVQPLIDSSFKSTRESLLWLFLGAHHWLHPRDDNPNGFLNSDPETNEVSCCESFPDGLEKSSVNTMISSLSQQDRIWLVKELVRKAPEYGQCRDLGGNLFNYFVISAVVQSNDKSIDLMFSILLKEISESPMQYLFEHGIGLSIKYYLEENEVEKLPWELTESKKYLNKLLRKNREVYRVLEYRQPIAL